MSTALTPATSRSITPHQRASAAPTHPSDSAENPILDLAVVIASVNGWSMLKGTLRSLDQLPERSRIEVIVVDAVGGHDRERIAEHRPAVTLVPAERYFPAGLFTIPQLRAIGIGFTTADLIAILEDHVEVEPGWAETVLRTLDASNQQFAAVAGPVENGSVGWVNLAAFLTEYARYMKPLADGPATDLPGNNIAYRRPSLLRHAQVLEEGRWESWVNDRLLSEGQTLATANAMAVRHVKPFRLLDFLRQRYHFSRSYAGMRRVDQSPAKRIAYGLGSLGLPALLLARLLSNLARKRRIGQGVLIAIPLVMVMLAVGAWGEMFGYLIGPGRSLERVR